MVAQRFPATGTGSRFSARLEARPARVRTKTRTVSLCELLETGDDARDAAVAGVLQRPAAERRESRAEDDRGIEEIRLLDHAFAQHGRAFVDEREDEPVRQIGGRLRGGFTALPSFQT